MTECSCSLRLLTAACLLFHGAQCQHFTRLSPKHQGSESSLTPGHHTGCCGGHSREVLGFSLLCSQERNCWSDGMYGLDLARWCQSTLQNRVRSSGPPQGKALSYSYGPADTCQSSLQVLASLLDAEWDLAAFTSSSPIIDEPGHLFIFLAFQGSSPCEGPLYVLAFLSFVFFLYNL